MMQFVVSYCSIFIKIGNASPQGQRVDFDCEGVIAAPFSGEGLGQVLEHLTLSLYHKGEST